jgi:hypothetical protein
MDDREADSTIPNKPPRKHVTFDPELRGLLAMRAARLAKERMNPGLSIPAYVMECSNYFEANRQKGDV